MERYKNYKMYPPYSKKRGIGVILIYKNFTDPTRIRKGAEKEEENLKKLFKEWSLEVHIYRDLTAEELEKLFSRISGSSENNVFPTVEDKHEIVVIAISSHGGEDYFLTSDTKPITHLEIKSYFNPKIFKWDIPKFLIFNHCRESPRIVQQTGAEGEVTLPPDWENFLILHACRRGTASYRSTERGSLCLKELYTDYVLYGRKMDIESFLDKFLSKVEHSILQITSEKGKPSTQQPTYESTLKGKVFFQEPDKISPVSQRIEAEVSSDRIQAIATPGEEDMEKEELVGLDIETTYPKP